MFQLENFSEFLEAVAVGSVHTINTLIVFLCLKDKANPPVNRVKVNLDHHVDPKVRQYLLRLQIRRENKLTEIS